MKINGGKNGLKMLDIFAKEDPEWAKNERKEGLRIQWTSALELSELQLEISITERERIDLALQCLKGSIWLFRHGHQEKGGEEDDQESKESKREADRPE